MKDQVISLDIRAVEVCADYERWAAEVARLTKTISETYCPNEPQPDGEGVWHGSGGESCFTKAKTELCGADVGEDRPGMSNRGLTLDELEEEVADCESCTRLVRLIQERKEARKTYGVAKRRVRAIGKRIIAGMIVEGGKL